MADTPTPPDKPKARPRRTPPRHADAAKPARGAAAKRAAPAAARAPANRKSPDKPKPAASSRAPAPAPRAAPGVAGSSQRSIKWPSVIGAAIAAIGAVGGLIALRGSTPRPGAGKRKAHQADGTDSSESFNANIADEGTIPDKM